MRRLFAVCPDLGHTANRLFYRVFVFFRVFCTLTHGKYCVCRVSSICRVFFGSVRNVAHGRQVFSCSGELNKQSAFPCKRRRFSFNSPQAMNMR